MKNIKFYLLSFIVIVIFVECERDLIDSNPATLLLPMNNETCFDGININNDTSAVIFSWEKDINVIGYNLIITNRIQNTTATYEVAKTEDTMRIKLRKAQFYAWKLISKYASPNNSVESATWQFYLANSNIGNFAPFPAKLISPVLNSSINSINNKVTLKWECEDSDTSVNELNYQLFFGTDETDIPKIREGACSANDTLSVNVNAGATGTTYFWKIITTDPQDNSSSSHAHYFTVIQ